MFGGLGRSFRIGVLTAAAIATFAWPAAAGPGALTKQNLVAPTYEQAVAGWEAFKAAQPPACAAAVDSTEVLHGGRTGTVVIMLHGFAGNPGQMAPLTEMFAAAGANVIIPRLAGHFDQNMDALDDATFQDWLDQATEVLAIARGLGERVIVAGYSLGGLLASYLALEYGESIDRLLLLAPAWKLQPRAVVEADLGALLGIRRSALGDAQICEVEHFDLSARGAVEVHRLAEHTERTFARAGLSAFALIEHPILMSVGATDQIVDTPYVLEVVPEAEVAIHVIENPDGGHLWYMQSRDLYRTGNPLGDEFIADFQRFVAQ
ncbi:MAG: alpha/beta hydrolase [Bauldia sp.]